MCPSLKLQRFLPIFLQSFSKIFSSEKQKPKTKSLPKAENQTKCRKTIFQKSAESQKCSNNKNTCTKSQKWNREILISAMSSSVIQVKCFLDFSDKILSKSLLKKLKLSAFGYWSNIGFSLIWADFQKKVLQFLEWFWQTFGYQFLFFWTNFFEGKLAKNQPKSKKEIGSLICVLQMHPTDKIIIGIIIDDRQKSW